MAQNNQCTWVAPMVTLCDGRQVPSDSEEWRAECEARYVLAIPHEKRAEFYQRIEARRGADAVKRLKELAYDIEPHYVMGLPSRDHRRHYASKVEHYFGQNARENLESKVRKLWEEARAVAEPAVQSA